MRLANIVDQRAPGSLRNCLVRAVARNGESEYCAQGVRIAVDGQHVADEDLTIGDEGADQWRCSGLVF
jgi:hypothetical protein